MENQFSGETAKQLGALLDYWLKHNAEHAAEFAEWAKKVLSEKPQVADLLKSAVRQMNEANVYLEKAKKLLV